MLGHVARGRGTATHIEPLKEHETTQFWEPPKMRVYDVDDLTTNDWP